MAPFRKKIFASIIYSQKGGVKIFLLWQALSPNACRQQTVFLAITFSSDKKSTIDSYTRIWWSLLIQKYQAHIIIIIN